MGSLLTIVLRMARHVRWFLEECSSDAHLDRDSVSGAGFESILHLDAYRIDASHVLMGDTRRPVCASFLFRIFFAF